MRQNNKFIIGLTGGSGCGKSVVAKAATDLGFVHIDTDKLAHEIILKPSESYYRLVETFGETILSENGEIDRKKLGAIVFTDAEKLNLLNSITHPAITEKAKSMLGDFTIIDGAVLHKTPDIVDLCDCIIAVTNSEDRRIKFICKRDNIETEAAKNRISSQPDNDFYANFADIVIHSDCDIEELYNKSIKIIKRCISEKTV